MAGAGWRLATMETGKGPRAALVVGDKAIDVAAATGRGDDASIMGILTDWQAAQARLDEATKSGASVPLSSVRILAPIPLPGAIYCAGANYMDHAAEMARAAGRKPPVDPHTEGQRSWHFIKSSRSVIGTESTVAIPAKSTKLDWEAELAVIIGRKAKDVAEADALAYVAGYANANDLSARDFSRRDKLPDTSSFKNDWLSHKSFDGSCPLGPFLVPARDVPNPHDLRIELDVNGVEKQNSNTSQMIFNINEQIADLSSRVTLWPGDIILTGTPAGVGNGRGEFLKAGDVVRVRITGLGELVTRMA
jgi:2-keto-4-pentenoate hydratase/2-oxohepta-3-ene-1,7-dioic acid hydratase in catechol pathway